MIVMPFLHPIRCAGTLVQENLHLYRWAHSMTKLVEEVETCVLFYKLQGIGASDVNFEEVSEALHSPYTAASFH
jgi:hypothetical protein